MPETRSLEWWIAMGMAPSLVYVVSIFVANIAKGLASLLAELMAAYSLIQALRAETTSPRMRSRLRSVTLTATW